MLGRGPSNVDGGIADGASTVEGDHGPWTEMKKRQRAKGTKDFGRGNGRCLLAGKRDQGACTRERMMVVRLDGGMNDGSPSGEGMMVYRWGRAVG